MRISIRWLIVSVSLLFVGAFSAAAHPSRAPRRTPARHARSSHYRHSAARSHHSVVRARERSSAHFRTAAFRRQTSSSPASAQSKPASTASAAKKPSTKKRRRRRAHRHFVVKQKAPTPARISEIQSALARNGYYRGDPNGKWDSSTVSGLQKFQAANGLDSTGKLDALTLQKLGLGSDIAGVAAPQPPAAPGSAPSPAKGSAAPAPASVGSKPAPIASASGAPKPASAAAPGDPVPAATPAPSKSAKPDQPAEPAAQSAPASAAKPSDPTTPH